HIWLGPVFKPEDDEGFINDRPVAIVMNPMIKRDAYVRAEASFKLKAGGGDHKRGQADFKVYLPPSSPAVVLLPSVMPPDQAAEMTPADPQPEAGGQRPRSESSKSAPSSAVF